MFRRVNSFVGTGALAMGIMAGPVMAGSADTSMFGGEPFLEREDSVKGPGNAFSATIYTAVYAGKGTELPDDPVLFPISEGETVFIYLIENSGSKGVVDYFALMNPEGNPIPMVAYAEFEMEGWDDDQRIKPSVLFGGKDHVEWQFKSKKGVLDPGDWAVLVFRTTGGWDEVDGWVGSMNAGFASMPMIGPGAQDKSAFEDDDFAQAGDGSANNQSGTNGMGNSDASEQPDEDGVDGGVDDPSIYENKDDTDWGTRNPRGKGSDRKPVKKNG